MRGRQLIILCVVTAALIAAAVIAARWRAPEGLAPKQLLFPDLAARINDVAEIRIVGKGRHVTLARDGQRWTIREADHYPALFEKVREVAVSLAGLRLIDRKTGNPDYYVRLGVEYPGGTAANSMLLTLLDASGGKLAELIVGRSRMSAAPGGEPGLYVRFPEETTALLVEGRLNVTSNAFDWFERDLFDIAGERIRLVEITHGDGERLRVERSARGGELALVDLPAGRELQSPVVLNRMATVLEGMFADGVRAAGSVQFPADAARAKILTFDGLVAETVAARIDGTAYATFSFRYDTLAAGETAPAVKVETAPEQAAASGGSGSPAPEGAETAAKPDVPAEVAALNARTEGWRFEIPDYRFELLTRRVADLLKDEKAQTQPAE
jgi:hypothetical protein